jgi:hypothetical protein
MRLPRNAQIWLPGLLRNRFTRNNHGSNGPQTVWLTFTDHFEPMWRKADAETATARVATWRQRWPEVAARHRDHLGRAPRYTFFYAEEEYRFELMAPLAELTRLGIADVEVHIHHDGEGEADFVGRISNFVRALRHDHGLLRDVAGRPSFGFIHGNWALDNAHPRGRHCGLNHEINLLLQLGCYADFTLPAAPDGCQTSTVNSIYWAVDDPSQPKSHNQGVRVVPGGTPPADGLLMVQGPLTVRWPSDRWPRPALEVGELAGHDPVTRDRAKAWLDVAPRIADHRFVKLHTHGAPEKNAEPLLKQELDQVLTMMREVCDQRGWQLVFASAWETAQAINALSRNADPLALLDT